MTFAFRHGFALLLAASLPSLAADWPVRKPGLWQVSLRGEFDPPERLQSVAQCTDAATDRRSLLAIVAGQEDCSRQEAKRTARGHSLRTTCRVHDTRIETTMEIEGDVASAYRGSFRSVRSREAASSTEAKPGVSAALREQLERAAANRESLAAQGKPPPSPRTLFEARWLGPCRPGMKPGEMVLPNGVTVNVMLGAAKAARTPPPAR